MLFWRMGFDSVFEGAQLAFGEQGDGISLGFPKDGDLWLLVVS